MAHPWLMMVSPVKRPNYMSSGWSAPRAYRDGIHHGVDFPDRAGNPVYAALGGFVEYARRDSPTAGHWVGIRHERGLLTRYLHLTTFNVRAGEAVSRGQQIGTVGSTGTSSAPHLHFDSMLPADRLSEYESLFGRPAGGYGELTDFKLYKVPTEPLVPADKYSSRVVDSARRFGIRLYSQVPGRPTAAQLVSYDTDRSGARTALGVGLGILVVGAGYFFWTSRRRATFR